MAEYIIDPEKMPPVARDLILREVDGLEEVVRCEECFMSAPREPGMESYLEDEMLVVCPRCYGHVCSALGVERPAKDGEQR